MGRRLIILAALATSVMGFAAAASAQGVCQGPRLAAGSTIHGPVLDIPDAATLCVATGASPSQWTAVAAPQLKVSRAVLMAAAFGRNATCTMGANGVADCSIDGAALASAVKQPEIIKASLQWRDRPPGEASGPTLLASAQR